MPRLRTEDLHSIYSKVSQDEAIAIANLGAVCYLAARDGLYESWSALQSESEEKRAATYRQEGAEAMMTSLKERLAAGDAAKARVSTLQATIEAEVTRRVGEMLDSHRKDYELAKKDAVLALEKRVAEAEGRQKMYSMLEEAHSAMRATIAALQEELAKAKEATSVKSSHALGKIGEAEVLEMLNTYVLPRFPYAEVKDMTTVKHATDFHLSVSGPTGKRVKILLDSKKYTSPIQQCEIEKLYKDIDADDEADAGIMVSLDTPIFTKSQFQIAKTKRNRPCMFLTFQSLDDGIRQEVLCWAIRVLVSIVSVHGDSADTMVEEIAGFLKDLNASVADLEGCTKSCKSLMDMLRNAKENLVDRITAYRVTCGMDIAKAEDTAGEGRCTGKNVRGEPCKAHRAAGTLFCARHGEGNGGKKSAGAAHGN